MQNLLGVVLCAPRNQGGPSPVGLAPADLSSAASDPLTHVTDRVPTQISTPALGPTLVPPTSMPVLTLQALEEDPVLILMSDTDPTSA